MKREYLEVTSPIRKITVEDVNGVTQEMIFPTQTKVDQLNNEDRMNDIWPRLAMFSLIPDEEGNSMGAAAIIQGCGPDDLEVVAASALRALFTRSAPIHFSQITDAVLEIAINMYCEGNPIKEMTVKAVMSASMLKELHQMRESGGDPSAN